MDAHLGFRTSVCDELFVGEPLAAVSTKLEVETGHKRVKMSTTLSEQSYKAQDSLKCTLLALLCFYESSSNDIIRQENTLAE